MRADWIDMRTDTLGSVRADLSVSQGPPATTVPPRARGAYERFLKPTFDRVSAGVLLLVLVPVLALLVLLVWSQLGAPVFFQQARVGRDGRPFLMYKFRTMHPDRRGAWSGQGAVSSERRITHKSAADPRLVPAGRFLRKWSLDELPQLWNVVRGEMSLVGPRPELVSIVWGYEPWQHRRHDVTPGLTGLWQVSARGSGLMHEHVEADLAYVDSVSLRTDLMILLRTLPAAMGLQKGL